MKRKPMQGGAPLTPRKGRTSRELVDMFLQTVEEIKELRLVAYDLEQEIGKLLGNGEWYHDGHVIKVSENDRQSRSVVSVQPIGNLPDKAFAVMGGQA